MAQIGLDRRVYDKNQPIVVEFGVIGFFPACSGYKGGKKDFMYPWADIYIIKGGETPAIFGKLTDVNGSPNTVVGPGIFGQAIGYAGVKGLEPGTYSIVVDECQDGVYTQTDTLLLDEFRVSYRTAVDPLVGIETLKANAEKRTGQAVQTAIEWEVMFLTLEVNDYASHFISSPPLAAIGLAIGTYIQKQIEDATRLIFSFVDPKAVIKSHHLNVALHWRGIAADPPDYDFSQPTVLASAAPALHIYDDPLYVTAAAYSRASAAEDALAAGFLQSIERYQGADNRGDGEYALVHARQSVEFAQLLAQQLNASADAADTTATALEASPRNPSGEYEFDVTAQQLGEAYTTMFDNGLTSDQRAVLAASGVSQADFTASAWELHQLDMASYSVADHAASLREQAGTARDLAAEMSNFAAVNAATITALEANPDIIDRFPHADAGGPYTADVGQLLTVDAAASSPGASPIVGYEWDADGDGAFDDGNGATTTVDPGPARYGLIGVRVTDENGATGVSYSRLIVDNADRPAVTFAPADPNVTVQIGQTTTFTATTPARWLVDGVEVASGETFGYSPDDSALGDHLVQAAAGDTTSGLAAAKWRVTVTGPDNDNDGYAVVAPAMTDIDCDDADNTRYPGAPELADGKDNDCDPATPVDGVAPMITAVVPPSGSEGGNVTLQATIDSSGAAQPISATVHWGDGISNDINVSGSTVGGTHAYAEDGQYPVQVCASSAAGLRTCATTTATISNVAATPRFDTLAGYSSEGLPSTQGKANWVVSDDGTSVLQTVNSSPGFFIAPSPLIDAEASVSIEVQGWSDDDYVGFVLGMNQGDTDNENARWLLLDWKRGSQGYGSCLSKDEIIGGGDRGLALSYVSGVPHDVELWMHCRNSDGKPGSVRQLARGKTLGDTGWDRHKTYQFRVHYSADRLQIWVDEELEFDLAMSTIVEGTSDEYDTTVGEIVGGTFPYGGFGFYNYSQDNVSYSNYRLSRLTAIEGTPLDVAAQYRDPGVLDVHTATMRFGDGSPAEAGVIDEANGVGSAVSPHTYIDEGAFSAEMCLTDDDGGVACQPIQIDVANAAPIVNAGRDRTGGPAIAIDDISFSDPGTADTHTATIDWGDGTAKQSVAVESQVGRGKTVDSPTHTYTGPGTYMVTVCATDNSDATGCDTATMTIVDPIAPTAETIETATVLEGQPVDSGVAFTDPNTSNIGTATVDWGDGSPSAPVSMIQSHGRGTGGANHVYTDDGVYNAVFEVCDNSSSCDDATTIVTVDNQPPTINLELPESANANTAVLASAPYTDPGASDTHTAKIDWGDGTVDSFATVRRGNIDGTHAYAGPGEYQVEVCIIDDDGGQGCATAMTRIKQSVITTTTTATTTTSAPTTQPAKTTTTTTTPPPMSIVVSPPTETTLSPMAQLPPNGNLPGTGADRTLWLRLGGLFIVAGLLLVGVTLGRRQRRLGDE